MATTRNGHELKDMYHPETNTLDIRWISSDLSCVRHSKQAFSALAYRKGSNGLYPSNVLSNMCSNGFRFDGVGAPLEEKSIRRKKLMYLHGFGSSAASGTVKTLRELLPDFDVVAPDIPVESFRLFLLRASAKSKRALSLLSACRRLIQQKLCHSCEGCV